MRDVSEDESEKALKGKALDVYRFMLKKNKPVGAREVQRALGLSSPSVAVHHLSRLEDVGILRHEAGGYVVNKVVLEQSVKLSRFLVPRFLFYAIFAVSALILELTFFSQLL